MFTRNSKDVSLLQIPDNSGYPTEYLLARLRGRSVRLIGDWTPLIHAPDPIVNLPAKYGGFIKEHSIEGVWRYFLREFQWVYRQMNEGLRDVFFLFFLYPELKTLLTCLRYKATKGTEEHIERLLALSLLSVKIKSAITEAEDPPSAIEDIEDAFNAISERFKGLKEIFIKSGLKGVEQRLTDVYLEHAVSRKTHPVIKGFFTYVIDARNITTVYKCLRWGTSPSFVHGGSIEEARLTEVIDSQDIRAVWSLIYKLTGSVGDLPAGRQGSTLRERIPDTHTTEPTSTNMTGFLVKGLMSFSKKKAKEFLDMGYILYYLLRCHREAKNLSIILQGRAIDRTLVRDELIY